MSLKHYAVEVATTLRVQWHSPVTHLGFSGPLFRTVSNVKKRSVEALWRDFFSNTSQWWDHRPEKINPKFPDFKHKETQESLWVRDLRNPPWVQAELAAVEPGTLESNVFAWDQRLKKLVKAGQYMKTLEVFQELQQEGVCPDTYTFLPVLNACAGLGALEEGRRVHNHIIQVGLESDIYVATCLVDMYAKCGSILEARSMFNKMQTHTVVSWTAMIGGYVKSRQGLKAIELYREMQQEGVEPDVVTFLGVLNACASVVDLEAGRRIHEHIVRRGCESDLRVATCLIDMYAKCGSIGDAWSVFNKMRKHNVMTWTAMIGGLVKSGQGLEAIELFAKMQLEVVVPDAITFMGVLNACASVAALEEGRRVHEHIIQRDCESDIRVGNSLVDMYAKCGSIEDAESVFEKMPIRNMVTWTAMIGGYAMHGHAEKAIGFFERMGKEGVKIDAITFTCLLTACNHGGLVKEGMRYFESMSSCFNILPTLDHYACMVNLLGRAGQLGEAEELTKTLPLQTDVSVWMSLLGACRIYGNIEIAERAAKRCWELDPENISGHLLLSNIYAAAGKFDLNATMEEESLERNLWREPGRSWIEVNHVVHSFVVYDKEHPKVLEIDAELERLSLQMDGAGYVPDMRFVSQGEKRRSLLCHHSEMLAIAYGLISTPPGTSIRVKKDLRMCPVCHDATKFIANMVQRVVTVKDANRFHRFEGGICSCKDYW